MTIIILAILPTTRCDSWSLTSRVSTRLFSSRPTSAGSRSWSAPLSRWFLSWFLQLIFVFLQFIFVFVFKPTVLPYSHLFDVDACAKFVSDFVYYNPDRWQSLCWMMDLMELFLQSFQRKSQLSISSSARADWQQLWDEHSPCLSSQVTLVIMVMVTMVVIMVIQGLWILCLCGGWLGRWEDGETRPNQHALSPLGWEEVLAVMIIMIILTFLSVRRGRRRRMSQMVVSISSGHCPLPPYSHYPMDRNKFLSDRNIFTFSLRPKYLSLEWKLNIFSLRRPLDLTSKYEQFLSDKVKQHCQWDEQACSCSKSQ